MNNLPTLTFSLLIRKMGRMISAAGLRSTCWWSCFHLRTVRAGRQLQGPGWALSDLYLLQLHPLVYLLPSTPPLGPLEGPGQLSTAALSCHLAHWVGTCGYGLSSSSPLGLPGSHTESSSSLCSAAVRPGPGTEEGLSDAAK